MKKWEKNTIGELCDIGGGQIKTGPFGSQLHQSDYQENGTPVIMPTDISDGKIDTSKIARVSSSHVERLHKHKLLKGDIIYGRRGDIGRQALARDEYVGWLCGTGCLRVTLGNSKVLPEFLHLYLKMPGAIGWIQNQAIGATMPNLNTTILRSIPVSYPASLEEQKQIIHILSAYDELIDNNNQRISLLEQMTEEIYKEWFVRLRFPGHKQTRNVGGVPEGWEIVKIEDAFDIIGGGTPSTKEKNYWKGGTVNWVTPTDITGSAGLFISEVANKITESGLSGSSAKLFPPYSVMMTSRATIGAIGINTQPACTNQGFIICLPNSHFPYTYIASWLKINRPLIDNFATGATFKEIAKTVFKRLKILKPMLPISKKYHRQVEPLYEEMNILLEKNKLLKQTRDLLLPRLMSGKLSVDHLLSSDL